MGMFAGNRGRPLKRRQTHLITMVASVVLAGNRAIRQRTISGRNFRGNQIGEGSPAVGEFGDGPNNVKEPGGHKTGKVRSDRLRRFRDEKSIHTKRYEGALFCTPEHHHP